MELMDRGRVGWGERGRGRGEREGLRGKERGISFKEKLIPRDKNSIILPRVYI